MHIRFSNYPCVIVGLLGLYGSSARAQLAFYSTWGADSTNTLTRLDLSSNTPSLLRAANLSNFGPLGIDVDPASHSLYYADVNNHTISRVSFNGTGKTDLVAGLPAPTGLAVDVTGGKIYWTDTFNNVIQRSNLDGSNVQTIVSTGLLEPQGLALDLPNHRLYWSDIHTDKIGSVNLDGTNPLTWSTPGGAPTDVVIDQLNHKVIWSDFDTYRLYRSNLDGSNVEAITPTKAIDLPGSIAIDPVANQLYCLDWGTHALFRSNLDGSNLTQVYSDPGLSSLSGLVVLPEPSSALVILSAPLMLRRRKPIR
jgi:low density lipoprotein receptor-related protein 5/6